jgi:hypothetical protein
MTAALKPSRNQSRNQSRGGTVLPLQSAASERRSRHVAPSDSTGSLSGTTHLNPTRLKSNQPNHAASNHAASKIVGARRRTQPLNNQSANLPKYANTPNSRVRKIPAKPSTPPGLRFLLYFQHGSLVITFLLVGAALFIYSTTMYTQQLWSKEYSKLKTLQRGERQALTASEMLKNQIIRQAEQPGSGLVPKGAQSTIYLTPAPPRSAPPPQTPPTFNKADTASDAPPLGY